MAGTSWAPLGGDFAAEPFTFLLHWEIREEEKRCEEIALAHFPAGSGRRSLLGKENACPVAPLHAENDSQDEPKA